MRLQKYIYLLLFVLATNLVYGQKDNALVASVSYKLNQKKNDRLVIDDICILDIDKNQSFFYSKNQAENLTKMSEAFERAKITGVRPNFDAKDFVLAKIFRPYYLNENDKKHSIKIQSVSSQMLGSIEASDLQKKWQTLTDTLTINGFKCQKAKLELDNKSVVAWFCDDIPFQTGPLGYFGLPGLIVKLTVSDGFDAELNGIVYNKDNKRKLGVRDYTFVSDADLKKALENAKANRAGTGNAPSNAKKQTIQN